MSDQDDKRPSEQSTLDNSIRNQSTLIAPAEHELNGTERRGEIPNSGGDYQPPVTETLKVDVSMADLEGSERAADADFAGFMDRADELRNGDADGETNLNDKIGLASDADILTTEPQPTKPAKIRDVQDSPVAHTAIVPPLGSESDIDLGRVEPDIYNQEFKARNPHDHVTVKAQPVVEPTTIFPLPPCAPEPPGVLASATNCILL